ncbi:MAG TPA: methyltransferase domain-containing protein [Pseudobdellovibrionaceae bacterium]|nr:methyltransferase domain-containing protein [Pseudobdellovibrionaceae bacterium]
MNFEKVYNQTFGKVTGDSKFIESLLLRFKPNFILEMGAGGGRCLPLYRDTNIQKIYLNEISSTNIALLDSKKIELNLQNISLLHSHSFNLDVPKNSIEMILIPFAGIAEMTPILFTLSEAFRVLKDEGVLYFNAINPSSKITGAYGLMRSSLMKWEHSVSAETIKSGGKEDFEFNVHFEVRLPGVHKKFIIEQVHPDLESWKNLLSIVGFQIEELTGGFDEKKFTPESDLIQIVAKKTKPKEAVTTNSQLLGTLYNQLSEKYDTISKGQHYKIPNWVKEKLKPYQLLHPIILDLGCASGNVGELIKEQKIEPCLLFGTDLSNNMLEVARSKNIYTSLLQLDLSQGFPEPKSNLFDLVFALGFFEFIEAPRALLKDIQRTLKLGGEACITFEKSFDNIYETQMPLNGSTIVRKSYSKEQILDLLNIAKFKIIEISDGEAYTSPSTGKVIEYWYCHVKKIDL